MKRKIVSLLLSVALIIACLPVTAIADTGIEINATNFPDPVFREYVSNCFDDGDGVLSFYEMYYAVQIEIGDNNAISSLEVKVLPYDVFNEFGNNNNHLIYEGASIIESSEIDISNRNM